MAKTRSITVRLTDDAADTLDALQTALPYRVTVTEIVSRGIVLAGAELQRMAATSIEVRP